MRRLIALGAAVVGGVLGSTGTAAAHVVTTPGSATRGSVADSPGWDAVGILIGLSERVLATFAARRTRRSP
jgi:hypothetical protein